MKRSTNLEDQRKTCIMSDIVITPLLSDICSFRTELGGHYSGQSNSLTILLTKQVCGRVGFFFRGSKSVRTYSNGKYQTFL